MSEPVGVALLGTGFMSRVHSHALAALTHSADRSHPRPRLVSVAGRDPGRLRDVQQRFGWDDGVHDWREQVADERVRLFDNCATNALHAEPTLAAIAAGKHVVCEKPLGLDADQALAMWQAAERAGVVNLCAFNYRFFPAISLAKRLIDAGEIGEVTHFRSSFLIPAAVGDGPESEWRLLAAQTGSGALGDLGAHHIDVARHLVGEVASVVGNTTIFFPERHGMTVEVDDAFEALGTFESGATAVWMASRASGGNVLQSHIEIDGTLGSLAFEVDRLNELRVSTGRREWRTVLVTEADHPFMDLWWPAGHGIGWVDSFVHELRHVLLAIDRGEPIEPRGASFRDGYRCAEIVDAILRSARTGRREQIGYRD